MPAAPLSNRPQTIKQAKAAYKARGQPSLTDKEKRQLDRSIELDRRAWRAKEADKRKAELARKKLEEEKKRKEDLDKARPGSQRRYDRFGYKSSQMHMGAFLKVRRVDPEGQKETAQFIPPASEQESFEDDELDDATLLDAMAQTELDIVRNSDHLRAQTIGGCPQTASMPRNSASTHMNIAETSAHGTEDFESIWEDLDSSTQIARDLAFEEPGNMEAKARSKTSSISSGDFDLTIEDMEQLDPLPPAASKLKQDKKLMPPPPLRRPPTQPLAEFTMSQLEQFVDDDLQLTQDVPG